MDIHVINLDRNPERMERFRETNKHLRSIVRYQGMDGRTADRTSLVSEGIITDGLEYSPGSLGCALSHIGMWKHAHETQRPITIAEDDGIFSIYFDENQNRLISNLKSDWDFILWSASLRCYSWIDALPGGVGARIQYFEGDLLSDTSKFQKSITDPSLLRTKYLLGLICYSISPRGAKALLDSCLPLRPTIIEFEGFGLRLKNEGIDCIINTTLPGLRTYSCIPPLVIDDPTGSSVRINT